MVAFFCWAAISCERFDGLSITSEANSVSLLRASVSPLSRTMFSAFVEISSFAAFRADDGFLTASAEERISMPLSSLRLRSALSPLDYFCLISQIKDLSRGVLLYLVMTGAVVILGIVPRGGGRGYLYKL